VIQALRFLPRAEPLAPAAALAEGAVAVRLARRLLALSDEALGRLAGVSGDGILAVTAAEADLPWVDGVCYLGRDPAAPALLLPTARAPALPLPLLERALVAAAPEGAAPLAVLTDPLRLVPLGGERPVDRARLVAWLGACR
jgi:hypothetical protein